MKRILVATDLSSRSELAVMRAAALAKARNAELTVLNVLDDDQPPVLIAPQRLAIANLLEVNGQALKERLGVESKAIVRVGDPVVVINAVAEEIGADLLVMGAHRHTPLRDLFIGTTLERVVRNAKIPVLRAAGAPEEEYRRVLLALDFSPTSTRAVQMAGQLGFLDAASLTALHAFEPFAKGMMRYSGIKEDRVEHYVDQEELKANVELRDYVAGLGLGREDIQLRVGEGLPINVIMTEVRRQAPQLTVLGTQGLTGFRRALIGSVAEAALGDLPCDVLAVPPKRDQAARRVCVGAAVPNSARRTACWAWRASSARSRPWLGIGSSSWICTLPRSPRSRRPRWLSKSSSPMNGACASGTPSRR